MEITHLLGRRVLQAEVETPVVLLLVIRIQTMCGGGFQSVPMVAPATQDMRASPGLVLTIGEIM